MKTIGIVGYGELGRQIESFLTASKNDFDFIFFDDAGFEKGTSNISPFSDLLDSRFSQIEYVICLGYQHLQMKRSIVNKLIENNRRLFSYIHPTAIIDSSSVIGEGTIVYPNVVLDKNVTIGKGCLLNLSVTIAHDSIIGDCCFLAPSVTLSGFVQLGSMVFLGTGVNIANGIIIDDSVVCGIGTVVTRNIPQGQFVIGNPQRTVKNIILT